MATFQVTVEVRKWYAIEVDAVNEEQALELAREKQSTWVEEHGSLGNVETDAYDAELSDEPNAIPDIEWSRADSQAAAAEGWDICTLSPPPNLSRKWEIEVLSEPPDGGDPKFNGDPEAIEHVKTMARTGSQLHIKAIEFLARHNQYDAVFYNLQEALPEFSPLKHIQLATVQA
jgi:hypothetical protein